MRIIITPDCNGCIAASPDSNCALDHSAHCRRRHEADAKDWKDAKLEREAMRIRVIVKLSTWFEKSDKVVNMGSGKARPLEPLRRKTKPSNQ